VDAAGLEAAEAAEAEAEEEEVAGGGVCVRPRAAFGERDLCFLVMVACVCVVVLCWVCVWRET